MELQLTHHIAYWYSVYNTITWIQQLINVLYYSVFTGAGTMVIQASDCSHIWLQLCSILSCINWSIIDSIAVCVQDVSLRMQFRCQLYVKCMQDACHQHVYKIPKNNIDSNVYTIHVCKLIANSWMHVVTLYVMHAHALENCVPYSGLLSQIIINAWGNVPHY